MLTVIDLATEQVAWEAKMSGGVRPMAIEANPDGSTKRIFAQLSDLNGFAVVDFAERKEVARVELPKPARDFETDGGRNTAPSHGIGVTPDNKTLWVTSIPNNAVYVYSLDGEPKMTGQVDAAGAEAAGPRGDLGGGELGDHHAGRQDALRLERRLALGHRDRHRGDEGQGGRAGRRGAEAHQHAGDPRRRQRYFFDPAPSVAPLTKAAIVFQSGSLVGHELPPAGVKHVAAALRGERMHQQPADHRLAGIDQLRHRLEILARLLVGPGLCAPAGSGSSLKALLLSEWQTTQRVWPAFFFRKIGSTRAL